jgi:phage baseplate assembly protein W
MDSMDFGTDIDSTGILDSKGQVALVSGTDNVKQAIRNRLATELDVYIEYCDDYGTNLQDMFGDELTDNTIEWIKTEIQMNVLKDPRVASCDVEHIEGIKFKYTYRLLDDDTEFTDEVNN